MPDSAGDVFARSAAADREAVEARLATIVGEKASHHEGMAEAVGYSLLGGGKRLRALQCLWTHDALGGKERAAALDAACALECLHTYSLVHDDLPSMDDDDLRRGRPSAHRRFGEATAILVGDELLNLSYEVLSELPRRHPGISAQAALDCVTVLSGAAGTGGLITGQALDLAPPGQRDRALVERIHENKTGRLFSASMELGAVMAGSGTDERDQMRQAGLLAGAAFQITDDLLDIEQDKETLGKTPGKDIKSGKVTYPSVVGVEGARSHARELAGQAVALMPPAREPGRDLRRLVEYMVERGA